VKDIGKIPLPFIAILLLDIFVVRPSETLRRYCKGQVTLSRPEHLSCMVIMFKASDCAACQMANL